MLHRLVAFLILLPCAFALAAPPTPKPQTTGTAQFTPIGIWYHAGKFQKILTFPQAIFPTSAECIDALKEAISGMQEHGAIPDGDNVIGGCMPIPDLKRQTAT